MDIQNDDNRLRDYLREYIKYIFTQLLPQHGYALRGKQMELAKHILDVIRERGITLAEAEVGTGKTHAYLIAALLAKRGRINDSWLRGHYPNQSWAASAHMPVVISTSSIALQNAIFTDCIPELSRILLQHGLIHTPLTAVIRKGKEHFICEKRLQRYWNGADEETKALLRPYRGSRSPFDLSGADSLTPHMKRGICVSGGGCDRNCQHAPWCRYLPYYKELNQSAVDFQITNHNYFLADVLRRAADRKPLLPHYQMVVIDEAHKFLSAARSLYGIELAATELPSIAKEIHAFTTDKGKGGVNIHKLAKKLEDQNAKLFKRLNASIPASAYGDETERLPAIFDADAARHLRSVSGITADILKACMGDPVQLSYKERKRKALGKLNHAAERIAALRMREGLIFWLEKRAEGEKQTDILCAIPKNMSKRLHRDLWKKGIPIILTSGTLSSGGSEHGKRGLLMSGTLSGGSEHANRDFTRIRQTLGLDHPHKYPLSDVSLPSPFDHMKSSMLYISETVPFPDYRDKRYTVALADEIERLVTASHGHAAVLFTSYNVMGQVDALLRSRSLPFPLYRMDRGGIGAIDHFKRSGNGILLASGALWEGIDIPGDALSLVIIPKLPFPVPDPISDYERAHCGDMELYKQRVIIPDMQMKLKQGAGRLLRSLTDTGAVAICDSRARDGGPFRDAMLNALPEQRVTSSLSVLHEFFLNIKPSEYFT